MRRGFGRSAGAAALLLLLTGCSVTAAAGPQPHAAGSGAPGAPSAAAAPTAAPAPERVRFAPTETVIRTVYTTAYSWFDNTPPGSTVISNPVLHARAGGKGTYADPVTVAVGHSKAGGKDVLDFPAGTRFYVPDVRRYFIVEDTCGDGPRPQDEPCHKGTNADGSGSTVWVDLWIGGQGGTPASVRNCASQVTTGRGAVHTVIVRPVPGYVVAPGSAVFHDGTCDAGYGETVYLATGG